MKGLATLSFFAFLYLVIIIIFNEAVAGRVSSSSSSDLPHEQVKRAADDSAPKNDSNPLADLFQIGDPTMRTTLGAIFGAYKGNDQCSRKAFCMMGNYMKDMPGRDLLFLFMGNYIPKEYSIYYEIFKVAVIYGQNCDVYVCVPDSGPPDAASAAAPVPRPTPTSPSTTASPQRLPQQQNSNNGPQANSNRPPSLQDAFLNDNSFPR